MNLSYTKDSEFKPLGELLLEDNEEIKELKSLYQREEEYLGFLGPIESFIAHFYLDEPKLKDVDVIKSLRNVRSNYNKGLEFFKSDFERELLGIISFTLQNARKKITRHEFFLVLGHILWSLDNRKWVGDSRAYLSWIANFFGLLNNEEKKKFDNFYDALGKKHGISKEHIKLLKGGGGNVEMSANELALSNLDSQKFANYED